MWKVVCIALTGRKEQQKQLKITNLCLALFNWNRLNNDRHHRSCKCQTKYTVRLPPPPSPLSLSVCIREKKWHSSFSVHTWRNLSYILISHMATHNHIDTRVIWLKRRWCSGIYNPQTMNTMTEWKLHKFCKWWCWSSISNAIESRP